MGGACRGVEEELGEGGGDRDYQDTLYKSVELSKDKYK